MLNNPPLLKKRFATELQSRPAQTVEFMEIHLTFDRFTARTDE